MGNRVRGPRRCSDQKTGKDGRSVTAGWEFSDEKKNARGFKRLKAPDTVRDRHYQPGLFIESTESKRHKAAADCL